MMNFSSLTKKSIVGMSGSEVSRRMAEIKEELDAAKDILSCRAMKTFGSKETFAMRANVINGLLKKLETFRRRARHFERFLMTVCDHYAPADFFHYLPERARGLLSDVIGTANAVKYWRTDAAQWYVRVGAVRPEVLEMVPMSLEHDVTDAALAAKEGKPEAAPTAPTEAPEAPEAPEAAPAEAAPAEADDEKVRLIAQTAATYRNAMATYEILIDRAKGANAVLEFAPAEVRAEAEAEAVRAVNQVTEHGLWVNYLFWCVRYLAGACDLERMEAARRQWIEYCNGMTSA